MNTYFTEEHQWVRLHDDGVTATVGISQHAQDALGDVVFVDLPPIGKMMAQMEVAAVVESVKTAADVLMPLSGRVISVNEALQADPALANGSPMDLGWFFQIEIDPNKLSVELGKLIPQERYAH